MKHKIKVEKEIEITEGTNSTCDVCGSQNPMLIKGESDILICPSCIKSLSEIKSLKTSKKK